MQKVMDFQTTRKPAPKAFYAVLDADHGVLTMDEAKQMWFRNSETDELTAITPAHINFLAVNGEVGICEVQAMADHRHGGYAKIACSRAQEVR